MDSETINHIADVIILGSLLFIYFNILKQNSELGMTARRLIDCHQRLIDLEKIAYTEDNLNILNKIRQELIDDGK